MADGQRDARGRFVSGGGPRSRKRISVPRPLPKPASNAALNTHWRSHFLAALSETSNVKASADRAGVSASHAYAVRRQDQDFAAKWRDALIEGYENLEMDLLGYLRSPSPDHKLDVANGIRLLAHHRQFVAQQRAVTDNRTEQEVLDSIDAMIDDMRERAAANAALLADREADDAAPA